MAKDGRREEEREYLTSKNKEKVPVRERRVTVNFSIPLKLLFAIDEKCQEGKRSEFITDILCKSLDIK